mgnify:CR=1 FL=1
MESKSRNQIHLNLFSTDLDNDLLLSINCFIFYFLRFPHNITQGRTLDTWLADGPGLWLDQISEDCDAETLGPPRDTWHWPMMPDGGHGVGTMLGTGAFLRLVQEIDAGALIGVISRMCRMFSSSKH